MNTPAAYDAWLATFKTATVDVGGTETAVYSAPDMPGRRVVLFVHGINGDFHGFVPVAYCLRDDCRVVFVDLPGHGGTAQLQGEIMPAMRAWSKQLVPALQALSFNITAVAGHSFGCYVAGETNLPRMALLNPPFAASRLSRRGTAVLDRTAPVVAGMYSSYPAMVGRGNWLMHRRTKATDVIIRWSSRLTHVSHAQFAFQAHLAGEASEVQLVDVEVLARIPHLLIVLAKYDRVVDNAAASFEKLPQARVVTFPTDHASVTEMPEEIAAEIRDIL